jgi:hypothetical protein
LHCNWVNRIRRYYPKTASLLGGSKAQAAELRKKWNQRADRNRCTHPKQEVERGEDGMVTATYYCITCGKEMLLVYGDHFSKRLASRQYK